MDDVVLRHVTRRATNTPRLACRSTPSKRTEPDVAGATRPSPAGAYLPGAAGTDGGADELRPADTVNDTTSSNVNSSRPRTPDPPTKGPRRRCEHPDRRRAGRRPCNVVVAPPPSSRPTLRSVPSWNVRPRFLPDKARPFVLDSTTGRAIMSRKCPDNQGKPHADGERTRDTIVREAVSLHVARPTQGLSIGNLTTPLT